MITFSIIQKSHLESAHRLDAEYYQPEYLKTEDILGKLKTALLSEVCKITDGNHSKISEKFSDSGVRYLRGMDLSDFFISDADPVYIPEEIYKVLKRSYIFQNDVLVSIVGTVGLISIIADQYEKLTGNCKIAILHCKDIDPWFLATFLACRYGQAQIKRKVAGAVQTGIILKDLANILIPVVNGENQKQVKEIIQEAHKNQVLSKSLYFQAEDLLLKELGLKDFKPTEELSYIVNLSNVKSTHRVDAEYFQPKYDKIEKILNRFRRERLEDMSSLISYGTVPTSPYVEKEGVSYIKGENLRDCFIDYTKLVRLETDSTKLLPPKFYLKEGDIIISQMGTVGRTGLVTKQEEGWLFASFTIRVRLKEESKAILNPLFATLFIENISRPYYLLRRISQASVRQNTDLPTIKDLKVPILPKPTQDKIADLVCKSHQARKKAIELLEKAKREVEEFIEGKKHQR
ncbi:MAG: restriction endonuclease subunit S [Proteobacteria bacterium]|nr:restriction endonuclease subunit S [Pseudomonadota bacterium]